jgi:hypothetical protein
MGYSDTDFINTKTLAKMLGGIKPETIHRSLCIRGHYLNLIPIKLGNKRLIWRKKEVEDALIKAMN